MLKIILNIISGLLGVFKRLMCFLNIKRRRKDSGNILPMHSQVPPASDVTQPIPSNNDLELESWDSWGQDGGGGGGVGLDTDMTTNHHSNGRYGQQQQKHGTHTHLYARQHSKEEQEPEVDFFTDMTPQFKKATKILVKKKEENTHAQSGGFSNRLAVQSNVPLNQGGDLGAWEDSESAWAEEASEDISWQAHATLKEKRRLEREARAVEQLRKKQEREALKSQHHKYGAAGANSHLAAVKLS